MVTGQSYVGNSSFGVSSSQVTLGFCQLRTDIILKDDFDEGIITGGITVNANVKGSDHMFKQEAQDQVRGQACSPSN